MLHDYNSLNGRMCFSKYGADDMTLLEEYRQGNYQPRFMDTNELTVEQRTDPLYALKQLEKNSNGFSMTCSKCHHCR